MIPEQIADKFGALAILRYRKFLSTRRGFCDFCLAVDLRMDAINKMVSIALFEDGYIKELKGFRANPIRRKGKVYWT